MNNIKKKITATFLATLMILSVFAAFVTPAGATGVTPGTAYNTFTLVADGTNVALIGQDIRMVTDTDVTITGTVGVGAGLVFSVSQIGGNAIFDTSVMLAGVYTLNNGTVTNHTLTVASPRLTIDTRLNTTTTSVTSVAEGTVVDLRVVTNIAGGDRATIGLVDPIGNIHMMHGDIALTNMSMTDISAFVLNTTGLTHGTWTIQVRTVADNAQGLSLHSNVASLRIVDPAIAINATRTAVAIGERTTFTVIGVAGHDAIITTSPTGAARVIRHLNDIGAELGGAGIEDNFTIRIPADGTHVFTMDFNRSGTYTVTARDTVTGLDARIDIVVMEIGGLISGRVTCYAGTPVANAWISVWDPVNMTHGWAQTNINGNYTITGLAAGTYDMWIHLPEGVNLVVPRITGIEVVVGQTTTRDITLKEGGLISGRVTCYAGTPVADAWISVWDPVTWGHGSAQTDANGNYTITGLAAGTYDMWIHLPEGVNLVVPRITGIEVVVGQTTTRDITLKEGGLISGRVTCYAGTPVADAWIFVWDQEVGIPMVGISIDDLEIGIHGWAQTNINGNYTITGLAAGTYEMSVHSPKGVYLASTNISGIVVVAGQTTMKDIILREGGMISGRVTCYAGDPVAGALIFVWDQVTGVWGGWAVTNIDGNYTTTGLATGNYTIEVNPPPEVKLMPVFLIDIVVTANETTLVNVTMRPPVLSIDVIPPTATLNVTETQEFNATVLPAGANQSVIWSVTNVTVGTINATTGIFTANAAGTTNVTATSVVDANITGNATVTVVVPPAQHQ